MFAFRLYYRGTIFRPVSLSSVIRSKFHAGRSCSSHGGVTITSYPCLARAECSIKLPSLSPISAHPPTRPFARYQPGTLAVFVFAFFDGHSLTSAGTHAPNSTHGLPSSFDLPVSRSGREPRDLSAGRLIILRRFCRGDVSLAAAASD